MADPKLTIQFSAKGHGALKATLDQLHIANERLVKGEEAAAIATKKLA